jgi:hypothetical protein
MIILSWNAKYNLYYICYEIPKDLPVVFSSILRHGDFVNIITIYSNILFKLRVFELSHFTVYNTSRSDARVPLLEAVHDTQPNITLFTIEKRASAFLN